MSSTEGGWDMDVVGDVEDAIQACTVLMDEVPEAFARQWYLEKTQQLRAHLRRLKAKAKTKPKGPPPTAKQLGLGLE